MARRRAPDILHVDRVATVGAGALPREKGELLAVLRNCRDGDVSGKRELRAVAKSSGGVFRAERTLRKQCGSGSDDGDADDR